ncbi:MAG: sulfite exporter TauE/SafE family protein [Chitinophagales bacterium]|nr:sulfite exporter TauE/SafE family protein [Chitinophagaceae bacterium]MCB9063980.1 sulfite exporter TauE/SafE family protein [Chitinophagales bacterium]
MDYFLLGLVALIGSGLTLFSGFGLGTILVPVFALFFPIEIAIALTAIVHFLNNLFKLALLSKHADMCIVLRFGIPALLAAYVGAKILVSFSHLPALYTYHISDNALSIEPVKLVVAVLIIVFAILELMPRFAKVSFDKKYLPLGGILSGFFGGLSGHQGALRSMFLIKVGLTKEAYIATGVVVAVLIDISRIVVYTSILRGLGNNINYTLMAVVTLCAFAGAYTGNKLVKKITIETLHIIVAVMLLIIAVLLGMGVI